jgi:hypothetical protein
VRKRDIQYIHGVKARALGQGQGAGAGEGEMFLNVISFRYSPDFRFFPFVCLSKDMECVKMKNEEHGRRRGDAKS